MRLRFGSRSCPRFLLPGVCLLVAACVAKPVRVYEDESFVRDTPYEYYSSRAPEGACEIGKRALLSQGYQVDDSKPLSIKGEKYFKPVSDQANKLTITLVCLPSSLGSVIYANALQTHYQMKSQGSGGVSVAGLGSVSVPWFMDKDTLVQLGEETVTAPDFYKRLFELIKELDG